MRRQHGFTLFEVLVALAIQLRAESGARSIQLSPVGTVTVEAAP